MGTPPPSYLIPGKIKDQISREGKILVGAGAGEAEGAHKEEEKGGREPSAQTSPAQTYSSSRDQEGRSEMKSDAFFSQSSGGQIK